jgi:iron(III) transport system substrate-binding protein
MAGRALAAWWTACGLALAALLGGACAPGAPRATGGPAAGPTAAASAPSAPVSAPAGATTAANPPAAAPGAPAAESLDELYERAKPEGLVVLYGTLHKVTGPELLGAFERRFPGIKVEWTDGTAERLSARVIAETRGGRTLVDVFQTNIENVARLHGQGLIADLSIPEAAAYTDAYKGPYWIGTDVKFYVVGWNTNLVKPGEEPRSFEDLADPRWKDRVMTDPGDAQFLSGVARHKYGSDERALNLLQRIAANEPEFHTGHSEMFELLVAGQRDVCMTCFSHHFPPRQAQGAPADYTLSEGIGTISGNAVLKEAPHPNAARLLVRWLASEEGQQLYAELGHTPANTAIAPVDRIRPDKIYPMTATDLVDYARYERQWREIFRLRAGQ